MSVPAGTPPSEGPRLAVLGAFPWSSAQGSQLFAREQARALARAGARPVLVTYGRGPLRPPDDLPWRPIPGRISPRGGRSGPSVAKLAADAALLAHWLRLGRREAFDAVLAHNVEAAAVALAARPATGIPVVYVAHTLMGRELATFGPPGLARGLDAAGGWLDRALARRSDAVVALTEDARRELAPGVLGPVAVLPPGHAPAPPPSRAERLAACARAGVEPGRFALYTGNLDAYQGLDRLEAAASRLRERRIPVVAATHDPPRETAAAVRPSRARRAALRVVAAGSVEEVRALVHAAGVLLLPRRTRGGFPMKLLNYLESGRPVVASAAGAPGLLDGDTARILPDSAGAADWAAAVAALVADPTAARHLGQRGLRHLARAHDWARIAGATLELVGGLGPRRSRGAPRSGGRRACPAPAASR